MKQKFYTLDNILKFDADYNLIIGERSNGKTTAVIGYCLKKFIESKYTSQFAIIRRWEEDYKGKNGKQMFSAIISLDWINQWSNGEYNNIFYYGQCWYLCFIDKNGTKLNQCPTPFCMGFSLSSEEHYKSTAYPNIKYILFDEFITRKYYLPDEFVSFQNVLSTIIRQRDDVTIFMCGNTINKYCPYFEEMGLSNVKNQQQGTIDIYNYGDSGLKVAVEYCSSLSKSKKSNKYFAFNNPKLQMITNGNWEMNIYPHLTTKFKPQDIKMTYYIEFNGELLECKIIRSEELKNYITFIHRKTTPIRDDNKNLVFTPNINGKSNYIQKITKPFYPVTKKILDFFNENKVFYQSNEIGEIVRNYIIWCRKEAL